MTRSIDYGNLMHEAMRGLIRHVLSEVAEHGLPGAHHFFISFDTNHPDVEIADWLAERFPDDMTIVMQHWFDALEVTEDGFSITLNFGNQPERMYIPFDAIRTFVDPSVEFGLRFETQESDEDDEDDVEDSTAETSDETDTTSGDDDAKKDADVVSLDSFRK